MNILILFRYFIILYLILIHIDDSLMLVVYPQCTNDKVLRCYINARNKNYKEYYKNNITPLLYGKHFPIQTCGSCLVREQKLFSELKIYFCYQRRQL